VVVSLYGLGLIGVCLRLGGEVVGAAVGGYALLDFVQMPAIERLARRAGIAFGRAWDVARREAPIPRQRLEVNGELLQILGEAILKENLRSRQFEDSNVQLEAASSAKDDFMAVLSHELRTPLTPILAWAEALKEGGDPAAIRQAVDVIKRNALLQIRMIDDLLGLNLSTRGTLALDLERQDLDEVVRSAMATVSEAVTAKGVRLELASAGSSLVVEADAGRLQQILVNILSNAVKFTPAQGRIDVTLARAGERARVTVTDTGEGIAPEFLPHVFEVFRQEEQGITRRHSGLGVGLALVRRLTEMHGGEVEVASEGSGRGTRVTVSLPLAAKEEPVPAASPSAHQGTRAAPLRDIAILLAEDMDDSREVTRHVLESMGARVTEARDGNEALESVAARRPDIVLCDLGMPRMDGFTFLRELRRKFGEDLPVVAISGRASDADRERSRAAGFEAHVSKPYDWDKLVAVVGRALRRPPSA
jgi:signal transduction histidine kinase/CheY-like chemotaxis protein